MTSAASEEDQQSSHSSQHSAMPRFSFDDSTDMLDYLGLAGSSLRTPNGSLATHSDTLRTMGLSADSDYGLSEADAYLASAHLRNRSSTLAGQHLRPKLNGGEGRARSSSYLPSLALSPAATSEPSPQPRSGNLSGSQSPYAGNAAHSSLLNTALQNRLHQYSATSSPHSSDLPNRSPVTASRPRATSMGMLDQPSTCAGPPANNAYEPNMDPPGRAGNPSLMVPSASLASHLDSQNDLSAFLAGRNRAGTIAAFSGPGGRARAKQELLRMSQLQYEASLARDANLRPSSTGPVEVQAPTETYSYGRSQQQQQPQQQHKTGQRSGTSSPFVQPTRTLWIGHLKPTATSNDLWQAFSHYGHIETFRLVPERSCAFINYLHIADAIRARDDIVGRLGGRLGFGTFGPEGQVRVGFGKPESTPQSQTGLGGYADAFSNSLDTASEVYGTEPANQDPSRALWVGSIPSATPTDALASIFAPFGPIESVRVLASKSCAFVNFERSEDAILARKTLNGSEVFGAGVGPIKIGFAKVPPKVAEGYFGGLEPGSGEFVAAMEAFTAGLPGEAQLGRGGEDYRFGSQHPQQQHISVGSHSLARGLSADSPRAPHSAATRGLGSFTSSSSNSIVPSSDKGGVPLPLEMRPHATIADLQEMMRDLDPTDPNVDSDVARIARPRSPVQYYTRIPPVPDLPPHKRFDNVRLKELRKRLDPPTIPLAEADSIASTFLPIIVDLSSDFIGNTLVQKFFERCSEPMKAQMLSIIAPHLAVIGVHKNGTWAAQKIIDCTSDPDQRSLIVREIRPWVPSLLLDQFGNYVVQRVVPFGGDYLEGVVQGMVDRCWEVAQGRFGARSMRAVLEGGLKRFFVKQVALGIVLNAVPLATSQNGALLVTWLLDSLLPGRYRLLAPRFVGHLGSLCTHKLASQTVLRIVTQQEDSQASKVLLDRLLEGESGLLEEVLVDQVHGSQFITKLFTERGVLGGKERERAAKEVRELLKKHGLENVPPYRPLVMELGMAPKGGLEERLGAVSLGKGNGGGFDPWQQGHSANGIGNNGLSAGAGRGFY